MSVFRCFRLLVLLEIQTTCDPQPSTAPCPSSPLPGGLGAWAIESMAFMLLCGVACAFRAGRRRACLRGSRCGAHYRRRTRAGDAHRGLQGLSAHVEHLSPKPDTCGAPCLKASEDAMPNKVWSRRVPTWKSCKGSKICCNLLRPLFHHWSFRCFVIWGLV